MRHSLSKPVPNTIIHFITATYTDLVFSCSTRIQNENESLRERQKIYAFLSSHQKKFWIENSTWKKREKKLKSKCIGVWIEQDSWWHNKINLFRASSLHTFSDWFSISNHNKFRLDFFCIDICQHKLWNYAAVHTQNKNDTHNQKYVEKTHENVREIKKLQFRKHRFERAVMFGIISMRWTKRTQWNAACSDKKSRQPINFKRSIVNNKPAFASLSTANFLDSHRRVFFSISSSFCLIFHFCSIIQAAFFSLPSL